MANQEQSKFPVLGVKALNSLREKHPDVELDLQSINAIGVDLSGIDFHSVNLSHANLSHANLSHANLSHANLSHANLSHANLSHANLQGANLCDAILSGSNLRHTNLSKADLRRSDFCDAILGRTIFSGANIGGLKSGPDTIATFPSSFPFSAYSEPMSRHPELLRPRASSGAMSHDVEGTTSDDFLPLTEDGEFCSQELLDESSSLIRYPHLECPSRITLRQQFSLFVQLLMEPLDTSSDAINIEIWDGHLEVEVVLRIHENDFRVHDSNMLVMKITPEADSEVRFILTPLRLGEHRIRADFYQRGRRIGSGQRSLRVVETSTDLENPQFSALRKSDEIELTRFSTVPSPDLELYVQLDHHNQRTLYFTLHSPKEYIDYHHTRVGQVTLQGSPLEKMRAVYQQMNHLASHASVTSDEQVLLERRIASLGNNLWDELIPDALKQEYWKFSSEVRSLLITSDEPWVPWEMVKPYRYQSNGEREDQPFWCQQFALSRWMSGPGTVDLLTVQTVRPIAPKRVNLPAVDKEVDFIRKLSELQPDIVPLETFHQSSRLLNWLDCTESSVLHFAAHGMFDATSPDDSAIMLSDGRLCPSDIRVRFCGQRQRPIVFINACHGARMEFSFTGLGGWAERWISSRVGSFIGAMWEVDDEAALEFTKSFYTALLKDRRPIAEAFRYAREQIRQAAPHSSTWLAYVLYADPEGRVRPRYQDIRSRPRHW